MAPAWTVGVTPWVATGQPDLAEVAARAEALGFHSFWLPESHFVEEAVPSPLVELAFVAGRTRRLVLGTTSLLLPVRHPVLLAEEIATLDRLSGGRLVVGIGRGFRRELFEVFGVDPRRKRDLLEEHLQVLRSVWSGGPAPGPQADGPPVTVLPGPVQRPHPPLWMAAFGPLALEQAARLGMPYLASPLESVGRLVENWATLERCTERLGVAPVDERPVMRTAFVSDDDATLAAVRAGLHREAESWARRAAPVLRGSLEGPLEERVLVGSPAEVEDGVGRLREVGCTALILRCRVPGASRQQVEASVERLARGLTAGASPD